MQADDAVQTDGVADAFAVGVEDATQTGGGQVPDLEPAAAAANSGASLEVTLLAKASAEQMDEASPDEEDVEEGELAHRKSIPDTPLRAGAFHIFKGNVGIGIFLLPMVYNDMGYVLSPIVGLGVGVIVIDSMVMLLASKKRINRAKVQTFPEVSEFVFGSLMRVVVNVAIVMTQFSFCLMYMQSAGTIFSEIVDFEGSYKVFCLIQLFIVLPLCFLSNNLKLLAISSAAATCLVWFTVVGTIVFFVRELRENGGVADTIKPTGEPSKWPLFIASNITVLEGIAVVLPVENAVAKQDKPRVPLMVRVTMTGIICLYLFYALFGYLAYGCALKNTTVTVLPVSAFGDIVRCGLAINLLLTYPLQFVPAIQIIDKALKIPADRAGGKSKKAILTRVGINILIMVVAMLIGGDTIALLTGFVGATAAVFLAIILPAMLALHVDYSVEHDGPREGSAYFKAMMSLQPQMAKRLKCFGYIMFGIAVFVIGTTTVIVDTAALVNRMTHRAGFTHSSNGTVSTPETVSCDL